MNNKHQKYLFRPQVLQKKNIEQFRATNKKRGLMSILIVILFLVHMKVNFAAILDFFNLISRVSNVFSDPLSYYK